MNDQTNVSTYKERLSKFISQYDEFSCEESLHDYYLSMDDEENDRIINFWQDLLPLYQQQVTKSFRIKSSQVTKDFTLHGRYPSAVPLVLSKLFAKSESVLDSSYYTKPEDSGGILYSIGSYLSSYVWSPPVDQPSEDQEYINIQMLEKAASGLQRWVDENKMTSVMEESKLRKTFRAILKKDGFVDVEENIDLIFGHLRETGRLSNGTIQVGKVDVKIIKLAPVGQKFTEVEISEDEKAPFQLRELISHLDQQIEEKSKRVPQMNLQIKRLMKDNDTTAATKILRSRKNIEKYITGLENKKFHLDQILISIEQGEQNRLVFESLKVANKASKQLNQGDEVDEEGNRSSLACDLESLMSELNQTQSESDQVNQVFIDKYEEQVLTDQQLMEELEELEDDEQVKKTDNEAEEIERRLRELEIPEDEIIVKPNKELIGA